MRFLQRTKDGGKDSTVDAFFLFEIKGFASIALLRFNKGSRDNFHSHAFNARTWFLFGDMQEEVKCVNGYTRKYKRSLLGKYTPWDTLHKVFAHKTSWCFTVRGKWRPTWEEYNEDTGDLTTLSYGRKIVSVDKS